jgi:hypothetical protein
VGFFACEEVALNLETSTVEVHFLAASCRNTQPYGAALASAASV